MNKYAFAEALLDKDSRKRVFIDYLCVRSADYKLRFGVTYNVLKKLFGERTAWKDSLVDELVAWTVSTAPYLTKPRDYDSWEEAYELLWLKKRKKALPQEPEPQEEEATQRVKKQDPPTVSDICRKHHLTRAQVAVLNRDYGLTEIFDGHWEGSRRTGTFVPYDKFTLPKEAFINSHK